MSRIEKLTRPASSSLMLSAGEGGASTWSVTPARTVVVLRERRVHARVSRVGREVEHQRRVARTATAAARERGHCEQENETPPHRARSIRASAPRSGPP